MKQYRDLIIAGAPADLRGLRSLLASWKETKDWKHDEEAGKRLAELNTNDRSVVFRYKGTQAPAAHVFLYFDDHKASVGNIVPIDTQSLDYDQYNAIAARFAQEVLQAAADQVGCRTDLGSQEFSLGKVASPRTENALRAFSAGANKSTGSSHPTDAHRWDVFVIHAHRDVAKLTAEELIRWLVEEEGWSQDQAVRLAIEYESGRRLLRTNDHFSG